MGTYSDPALILPGTVGQTELDAASKKDVVGGVAALDGSGFLLAKGAGILFPRTGSDDVHIYERTSGEEAYAFHRVGADDYTFYIKESNVWKQFQTESMKDVAGGIAGLDASSRVLMAQLPDLLETYALGDDLLHSHDAEESTGSNGVMVKLKTVTLGTLYPATSSIRVAFDLKGTDGDHHAYGRIYKNGVALGTHHSQAGNIAYTNHSEDLEFSEGDTLELWSMVNAAGKTAYVRNLRITGDVDTVTYREAAASNDIGVADCVIGTNT